MRSDLPPSPQSYPCKHERSILYRVLRWQKPKRFWMRLKGIYKKNGVKFNQKPWFNRDLLTHIDGFTYDVTMCARAWRNEFLSSVLLSQLWCVATKAKITTCRLYEEDNILTKEMEVISGKQNGTNFKKFWHWFDGFAVAFFVGVNFFDKKDEMGRARVEEVRQRAEVQRETASYTSLL